MIQVCWLLHCVVSIYSVRASSCSHVLSSHIGKGVPQGSKGGIKVIQVYRSLHLQTTREYLFRFPRQSILGLRFLHSLICFYFLGEPQAVPPEGFSGQH